jgi:hypothetical protein
MHVELIFSAMHVEPIFFMPIKEMQMKPTFLGRIRAFFVAKGM